MIVVINPGHCPNLDSGAINYDSGLRECDVALSISKKVKYYLDKAGVTTRVLQDDDLELVARISNELNADLFVSIHCNAASNPNAKGFEIWTSPGRTRGDDLAECILYQIVDTFPDRINRGLKEADFYVLSSRYEGFPTVLFEAITLKKKIIATDVSGVKEMLEDGKLGLMVENSEVGIYEGMKKALQNPESFDKYEEQLENYEMPFNLENSVNSIVKIIDEL